MKKRVEERGVALLFALGMLTLLLVTGMAFVANALSARKVAANNSARTQARMFAQSALNRVVASIMMYQYQVQKGVGEFPENFDCVQSYGKVDTGSGTAVEVKDGLRTADPDTSLMTLPEDNTVVAKNIARQFNQTLASDDWDGSWVYFYNSCDTADVDRKIIGRAAWKVVSHSPQILAPVFLSGHLPTDGTPNWYPSNYRMGREIDEVFSQYSNSIFANITTKVPANSDKFQMQNYEAVFNALGISDNVQKRWIEKWFVPDTESEDSLSDPTEIVPEVYSYRTGGKNVQLLRFNISEILKDDLSKYGSGITTTSDSWYARFGINSTSGDVKGNNEAFLNDKFTIDSPKAAMDDEFDYKLEANERPSLPFLRRIGNVDDDKPTFSSVADWRKQIAANFNDYCDADSVPTSDVSAKEWMNDLTFGTDGKPLNQPKFTGNEKTPYIYELGFNMAIHPGTDTAVNSSKTGIEFEELTGTGVFEKSPYIWLTTDAIVKLANIYPFNPTGFDEFTAGVDLGKIEVDFKPTHISLNFTYELDGVPTSVELKQKEIPESMAFSTGKISIDGKEYGTLKLTTAADQLKNTDGKNTYPLLISEENSMIAHKAKRATLNGNLSFKLDEDVLKDLVTIPVGAKLTKFTLTVDAVEISRVSVQVNRVYLSGKQTAVPATEIGLDYVRAFANAVEWKADTASGIATAKIPLQEGTNIPGILIGGVRNYDPRQNLNSGDWYQKLDVFAVLNCIKRKNDTTVAKVLPELHNVMSVDNDGKGLVNQATSFDSGKDAANLLFRPYPETGDDALRDLERTAEPGWTDAEAGADATKHISTAFIRNAPMMSPWEIGFIHRGVRWQTINIRTACDPENNSNAITLSGHAPHDNKWDMAGTGYEKGDGAILDQIKMTDKCATYGKINVNRLRKNDPMFEQNKDANNIPLDEHIARALFTNISCGQTVNNLYLISKRNGDGDFDVTQTANGTKITTFSGFDTLTASRSAHTSRAQFVDWAAGKLETAFGSCTPDDTDAAQEEIIGKVVNLICAENTSPSQVQVVVVAQAIRDVAGMQFRKVSDTSKYSGTGVSADSASDNIKKECDFGKFDYAQSSGGYEENIYFDEITGEVKMLVTIERNINTGRMVIRRIDYLE